MNSTNIKNSVDDILLIIVLYNISLVESPTFMSLTKSLANYPEKQVDLFVYDNSPVSIYQNEILNNWKIHYIHDPSNPGVSKAYNEGFKLGKKLNKKWLMLLDQDTQFAVNSFSKYSEAIEHNPNLSLIAPILISENRDIYSPCLYRFKRGFPLKNIQLGLQEINNKSVLNSGLLIRVDMFEKVGGYNENLKLDFSDFDFLDRYRKLNSSFYIIDVECVHDLSSTEDDLNKALKRFNRYCISAKILAKVNFDTFILMGITLFRSYKLSIKFKNISFIWTFFKSLLF